jgi:glutamate racemase
MDNRPIGFFDSGIGGVSIWTELRRIMPHESTIYIADNGHCPYGPRPQAEIADFSRAITHFLLQQGCKAILVACNTASAAALEVLRAEFTLPIIGMEPAVKPAVERTRSGKVGVLATAGTVHGELFQNTKKRVAGHVVIYEQVGDGLVELVESGRFDSAEAYELISAYIQPMLDEGVDQIALGCTHYPFLLPLIRRIAGERAQIIDPAEAVARQAQRVLSTRQMEAETANQPDYQFYATAGMEVLRAIVSRVIGGRFQLQPLYWVNGSISLTG